MLNLHGIDIPSILRLKKMNTEIKNCIFSLILIFDHGASRVPNLLLVLNDFRSEKFANVTKRRNMRV